MTQLEKFNLKDYCAEHRICGYVSENYKHMIEGMHVHRKVSESSIVAKAVMQYFDNLPKEQREEYIRLSGSKQPRKSKNSY